MSIANPRNAREANYLALAATPEEIVERVLLLVAQQQQSVNLSAAAISGTLPVSSGGTSVTTLTAHGVVVGEGTSAVVGVTGVTGQVLHAVTGADPTFSAVSLTADISGVLAETHGGTNQSTYTLGDTLYASAANTVSKLTGNITATRKFLRQTGNGAVSAAPAWDTILAADVPGSALTKSDDTNVTLTLGGSASTALLNAASLTLGWTGQLGLTRGGTAASLTASNGGVVYSTAGALAILAGTATAGQILRSGSSTTPAWSTPTFPNTATANKALVGDGTNVVLSTPTIPLTSSPTSGKIMIGDGTNWVASTPTWPTAAGSAKNVPRSDGTNFVAAQLAASDLSNGTTGSGSVALAGSPTFTGTVTAAALTSSGDTSVGTSGITSLGTTVTTDAAANETVIPNNKSIRGVSAAGTHSYALMKLDTSNVMQLGTSTVIPVAIPYTAAASLDAGAVYLNGRIEVDSTNDRFIYYSGSARYWLKGTSF